MKAVVLEVRDGFAAVLQEDGTVTKIRTDAQVGETIQLPEQKKKPVFGRGLRAAVAGLALAGILAGTGYSYTSVMAYSYVSLDIADTSLEYTLNRRDQVLSVEGKNDSSLDLAQELTDTVRRKDLSDALEETVERIGSAEDYALVAVTSGSDKRAEDLQQTVHERFRQEGGPEVVTDIATRQEHDEARQQGVTAGRYRIGRELGGQEDYRSANIGDMLDRAGRVERPAPPKPEHPEAGQPKSGAGQGAAQQPPREPRQKQPPQEVPQPEEPRQEAPAQETPQQEAPQQEAPQQEPQARQEGSSQQEAPSWQTEPQPESPAENEGTSPAEAAPGGETGPQQGSAGPEMP